MGQGFTGCRRVWWGYDGGAGRSTTTAARAGMFPHSRGGLKRDAGVQLPREVRNIKKKHKMNKTGNTDN